MTFETHAPLLTSALVSISTGQQAWADAGADRCRKWILTQHLLKGGQHASFVPGRRLGR
jgi:hypothetical protein